MTKPMSKNTALPAVLSPPDPLASLLRTEGFEAELVIRRTNGTAMTAADRKRAARIVEESEERDASDDDLVAQVRAELEAKQAPAARTKRVAPASKSKAARTAKR